MTTTETPADALRAHLHGSWETVAPAWGQHAEVVDRRHERVTTWMLDATEPRPGDRVLELACGAGGLGLAASRRVSPGGHVVLSDVAQTMVAVAAERAAATNAEGVATRVLNLEAIDVPDASFDVILCRDGLQFAVDPSRAVAEVARVLAPAGRIAFAVWGPRAQNPWLGLVLDAVSAQLGKPVPPPGMPGPFALDDPNRLASLLHGARLAHVVIDQLAVPLTPPSFEAWWSMASSLAGPLSAILGSLPDATIAEIEERARRASASYAVESGLELPGIALLTSACKP